MKTVLVTGASGRLARCLIPQILERGYRVRTLKHRTTLTSDWSDQVEKVEGSITDPGAVQNAVRDADVVCHFAALMPPRSDDDIFETNVRGTYCLLQAVAAQAAKPRLVFASTDATYSTGWSLGPYTSPVDENTPQHPTLFYGASKLLGEQLCVYYQDVHRIPIVRLRFPTIIESKEFIDLFTSAPYKDFLIPEDADKWNDPSSVKAALEAEGRPFVEHVVDVRDAAQGMLLALEKDPAINQVFNIAGPSPFTYLEIGPVVAKRLGVQCHEGRCKGIYSFELSTHKARCVLGYRPKFGILESLEDAFSGKHAVAEN